MSDKSLQFHYNFIVNLDLSKPVVTVNRRQQDNVSINEGDNLNVMCSVDGEPTPNLSISRGSQEIISKSRGPRSLRVFNRKARCNDTDTYKCTAKSTGFADKHSEIILNVLCKLIWITTITPLIHFEKRTE
jgi:hypothetical protein